MALEIRELRPQECPGLSPLLETPAGSAGCGDPAPLPTFAEAEALIRRGRFLGLVAREQDDLVGLVLGDARGGDGVQSVLVAADRQDPRLTEQLVGRMVRKLAGQGVRLCRLDLSRAGNAEAFWSQVRWHVQPILSRP